ncbi:PREDICTED: uncharacterized protein LOC107353541 isoform X1 [Acropora digitifera]|uniref:uncharacterized protein LOC107353541 isoform X1 n=2 Tax=Acropora digitifera TaxID=70779 RepID=UPI00077A5960|nr:PREDICTED: uncharacterized protein LOC107353541 isoform X1 [Acropora digitifera]XP_029198168.1 uncharacterized protein LOC114963199 isoform X1 [Acropora millepora]
MEITKYIIFSIILDLQISYSHADFDVTSLMRKRPSIRPHGRHVANKRGWPTLVDTRGGNQTLPNVSPVAVVSVHDNVKQEENKATLNSNTIVKKTRRKRKKYPKRMLMRKIRDDQKSLSRLRYEFYPKRCKDWSDCKKDECCIRQSKTKGFCKKRPQRGNRCKPLLLPGLGDCPCDRGLTCTRYRTTKHGKKKHRCEHLRVPTDEVDHRYV